MSRKKLYIVALCLVVVLLAGCSKKIPMPGNNMAKEGDLSANTAQNDSQNINSLDGDSGINSKISFQDGKINSDGKYLGTDGVSRSGFKMLYFASDVYTLDNDQIKKLVSDIPRLKAITESSKLLIEGNCDEFGTDEYNHALGLKRAKAVKTLLINAGIDATKINTVSYGESNPVCTLNRPACHAKNRRVEINKN